VTNDVFTSPLSMVSVVPCDGVTVWQLYSEMMKKIVSSFPVWKTVRVLNLGKLYVCDSGRLRRLADLNTMVVCCVPRMYTCMLWDDEYKLNIKTLILHRWRSYLPLGALRAMSTESLTDQRVSVCASVVCFTDGAEHTAQRQPPTVSPVTCSWQHGRVNEERWLD
jgi:hypothetical protein